MLPSRLTSLLAKSRSLTGILLTLWLTARLLMCLGRLWNTPFLPPLSAMLMASTILCNSSALATANSPTFIPLGACELTAGDGHFSGGPPETPFLFLFLPELCTCNFPWNAILKCEPAILYTGVQRIFQPAILVSSGSSHAWNFWSNCARRENYTFTSPSLFATR